MGFLCQKLAEKPHSIALSKKLRTSLRKNPQSNPNFLTKSQKNKGRATNAQPLLVKLLLSLLVELSEAAGDGDFFCLEERNTV